MDLKDEQWFVLEPLLPKKKRRKDGKEGPSSDQRLVLVQTATVFLSPLGLQALHTFEAVLKANS